MDNQPTPLAKQLIAQFDQTIEITDDKKVTVNPVVAEVASWYEKIRTAMDYREEEVILRASIERILKRRLLMGGRSDDVAESLVRELVWARYFPEASIPEKIIGDVGERINLYLALQSKLQTLAKIPSNTIFEWIYHLMSSDIEDVLSPSRDKQLLSNYIFYFYKEKVNIIDDTKETKDAQVFIAVRRAFAKEDLALLHFSLFTQYFGKLTKENLDFVANNFLEAHSEFQKQLNYPLQNQIYTYIKKQMPPFLILEKVLRKNWGKNSSLLEDQVSFNVAVTSTCTLEYNQIFNKVKRAIVRSVVFILVTKAMVALAIEGSFESIFYGTVLWWSIVFNTVVPPILMLLVGLFIKVPGRQNTDRILRRVREVLFNIKPSLGPNLNLQLNVTKKEPILEAVFATLWLIAFFLSFGAIVFILTKLGLNIVSQGVFIFFLAIVSFLSYRIYQTAHQYSLTEEKQSLASVVFDFFFMPFIHAGRSLTLGISQLNILLFLFDFLIETPFKGLFSFFEQWFLYLRSQREKLD